MSHFLPYRRMFLLGVLAAAPMLPLYAQDSISGPVSQNLSQSNTTVAPTSSTEIVPGANNLLNPDDRKPVPDSTGSDIRATTMSPIDVTSYVVGSSATQVDGALKDSSNLSGSLLQALIGRLGKGQAGTNSALATSTANSFSSTLHAENLSSFTVSTTKNALPSNQPGETAIGSSWRVGTSSSSLSAGMLAGINGNKTADNINKSNQPSVPGSVSDNASMENEPKTLKVVGEQDTVEKTAAARSERAPGKIASSHVRSSAAPSASADANGDATQALKSSQSPLERADISEQDSEKVKEDAGPFKNLASENFLDPDIFAKTVQNGSSTYSSSTRNQRNENQSSSRLDRLRSSSRRSRREGEERTSATDDQFDQTRTMSRSERRLQKERRPRWHNPILQQMEEENTASTQ
jgi:hypothetical protein